MRRILGLAITLTTLAAATHATTPTTPHGEGGKITRADGIEYIAYTYIESPGATGSPAAFKVFRPRADPPAGLPKPRLLPNDVGSWVFIGEGSLAPISAMMDLDADGIVTWTFMSIDQLQQYRGANVATPVAATPATPTAPASAGSAANAYGHDPNLPKEFDELGFPPNDFGAGGMVYAYRSGRDLPPEVTLHFGQRLSTGLAYIGYNEQGSWFAGDALDNMRLYTYRGDVHLPYDCHSSAPRISNGQLTRQPYSVAVPKGLHNMPADVRRDFAAMPYGKGPDAAEEAAETARIHQVAEAAMAVYRAEGNLRHTLTGEERKKGPIIDAAFRAWGEQLDKQCGPQPPELPWALAHGPYKRTSDALVACRTSRSRERTELYLRATAEISAKNASEHTWREIGVL